jgi:hypothetical protein
MSEKNQECTLVQDKMHRDLQKNLKNVANIAIALDLSDFGVNIPFKDEDLNKAGIFGVKLEVKSKIVENKEEIKND